LYAVVYLKPKQLDSARRFVLKLYRHEASHGLFATAELLVFTVVVHANGDKQDSLMRGGLCGNMHGRPSQLLIALQ